MATFAQRLKRCMRGGNLTVADLARWLDRSDATVRTWVNGTEPSGAPLDVEHAHALLDLLESMIKRKLGFPIPRMSQRARIKHLSDMRQELMAR